MNRSHVDEISQKLAENRGWSKPQFIDSGASAAVYKVENTDYGTIALKMCDPMFFRDDVGIESTNRLGLQKQLIDFEHPNLVRFFDIREFEEFGTWYTIMEFLDWPPLSKRIENVPDENIASIVAQLSTVVQKLTEMGLVHRDIKPANIAISPSLDNIKLLDLGVARQYSENDTNGTDSGLKKQFIATVQYSPPEYIPRDEPPGTDGFDALNVYQIGAVLHDLLMKRPIFAEEVKTLNKYRLFKAILEITPSVFNKNVPPRLVSLCRSALEKNPTKRISSVSVEDFQDQSDNIETIRKRLAASNFSVVGSDESNAPSYDVWDQQIAEWIRSAALAEKEILGPSIISYVKNSEGLCWNLNFQKIEKSLIAGARRVSHSDFLQVSFDFSADNFGEFPALQIFESGPNIPEDQIVPQLSEQMLLALDSSGVESEPDNSSGAK